jgi:nuclear pore complex protein Nup93
LIADAVLLYHLAENYDRVIDIINRALSDAVAVELGGALPRLQPLRPRDDVHVDAAEGSSLSLTSVDDPGVLARNMISLYDSNAMYHGKVRPINREACGLLLRMMEAKTQVEAGRWAPALDVSNLCCLSSWLRYTNPYRLSTLWVYSPCGPMAPCH